jgi:hypothetical protein
LENIENRLIIKIFDDGKLIFDGNESSLKRQAKEVTELTERVKDLWPPHELTWAEKGPVVRAVQSLAALAATP